MKARFLLRSRRGFSLPDMIPVSGVFFLLTIFFLLTSSPRQPSRGLVALEESPCALGSSCARISPSEVVISLTANGLVSFASSNATLQSAVIKQVAEKYGVCFADYQLPRLGTLPFLATSIERLPLILSSPASAPLSNTALAKADGLGDEQLVACAKAARLLSPAATHSPASFLLVVDAKADASEVMHLFGLLRAQDISRFNLVTHNY